MCLTLAHGYGGGGEGTGTALKEFSQVADEQRLMGEDVRTQIIRL